MWLDLKLIKTVMDYNKKIFPVVGYAISSTPTYPSGTLGYLLASLNPVSGSGVRDKA